MLKQVRGLGLLLIEDFRLFSRFAESYRVKGGKGRRADKFRHLRQWYPAVCKINLLKK